MPTYVYHCEVCESQFEVFQRFSDPPLTACLEGHQRIRKVFVPAGIIFKGSGWYSKDSKADSSTKSSESADASSSSSDETTKAESTSSDSTESTKSETSASTTTKSDE